VVEDVGKILVERTPAVVELGDARTRCREAELTRGDGGHRVETERKSKGGRREWRRREAARGIGFGRDAG
jgi:hypothetical protein